MRMLLAGIVIALATPAHTHQAPSGFTYEPYCCNGNGDSGDCQRIAFETVQPSGDGYQVTLQPGDHRLVTRKHVFFIPQSKAMNSPDGAYHLCLFPNEDTVRCFYAPPIGF
ncbi:hypothetical protein A4U53_005215 (plasmid) [Rhizobium ruizarguesonis]|uniref:Uncharacterized protein n=1 Tax=Rhizobium ruizarguesonis TaxID=2081791 RepID=A0ACD5EH02_9HYPH|nr:hypothetical protein [Rhizobium leguminosarum]